jgi:endonuclease/exonuclease/phosphatase family metal-dependent hydrolase
MPQLQIVTLNVQGEGGPAGRQAALNDVLRTLQPDILALQEVMSREHLDALRDGTGMTGTHQSQVLGYEMPFADRYGGTAIATRRPHQIVEALDQRQVGAQDVPWCTLAATLHVPGAGELLAIATTFSWRLDAETARERALPHRATEPRRAQRPLPRRLGDRRRRRRPHVDDGERAGGAGDRRDRPNPTTGAVWTTSCWAPGTRIRRRAPRCEARR